jgi:hypothetical protein
MWSMLNCTQLVSFTPWPLYSQGKIPSIHATISVIKKQNPILDVDTFTPVRSAGAKSSTLLLETLP